MREYPTDEELMLFIEQMEQRELYAPGHLKAEILKQAFPEKTVEALPKPGGGEQRISLFTYRLKILAGMAAAIAMLMVIPSIGAESGYGEKVTKENGPQIKTEQEEAGREEEEGGVNVNFLFNENMRRANERLNSWVGRINIFE